MLIINNPIITGFHPDPSICRVGNDYYLVTSSFEYFPGIPLYHSTDLVNWVQIGNCLDRVEQLSLAQMKDSGGIWAPTIRHNDGVFYITATLEGKGNFIIHTTNIKESWSQPIFVEMEGIDPSLYFEEGKAYYQTNARIPQRQEVEQITMAEIDINTGTLKSKPTFIWEGTNGGFLEAPHLYKKDGWYYLIVAEGGTFFTHMASIARSRSLFGPYEAYSQNPVLSNRNDTSKEVQCTGHGDFIEDTNGDWWLVFLGARLSNRLLSPLGRETFLMPVHWENNWPSVGRDGQAKLEIIGPTLAKKQKKYPFYTDFTTLDWEVQWIGLRHFDHVRYQRVNNKLVIYPEFFEDSADRLSFIGIRQVDLSFEANTQLTFQSSQESDESGLIVYLASKFQIRFYIRRESKHLFLIIERYADDFQVIILKKEIKDIDSVRLKIDSDGNNYFFYYQQDDDFQKIGQASTRFLSPEIVGKCFTGTVIGLYATTRHKNKKTRTIVDYFSMKSKTRD